MHRSLFCIIIIALLYLYYAQNCDETYRVKRRWKLCGKILKFHFLILKNWSIILRSLLHIILLNSIYMYNKIDVYMYI